MPAMGEAMIILLHSWSLCGYGGDLLEGPSR
jgi:hypothetical protein